MGFFDDNKGAIIGSVIPGLGTSAGAVYDQMNKTNPNPNPPGRVGHAWTGQVSGPQATGTDDLSNLLVNTFGPTGSDYTGVFNTAYNNLGQNNEPVNPLLVGGNVLELAGNFAKQYQAKTGQLPTADVLKQFVGQTLTPQTAAKFIQGTYGQGAQQNEANSYIDAIQQKQQLDKTAQAPVTPTGGIQDYVNNLFDTQQAGAADQINRLFGGQRSQAVSDAAALGTLRSPAGYSNISNIDSQKNSALSQLAGQTASNKASSALGLEQQNQQLSLQKLLGLGSLGVQQGDLALRKLLGQNQVDINNQTAANQQSLLPYQQKLYNQALNPQEDKTAKYLGYANSAADTLGKVVNAGVGSSDKAGGLSKLFV